MVEVLFIVLVFSIGLVGTIAALARWRPNGDAAIAASLLFLVFSCAVSFSMALLVQGLLTAGWTMACAVGGWRPRTYLAGAAVAFAIGLGCGTAVGLAAIHEEALLREEFPIRSLAQRLGYETRPDRPSTTVVASDSPRYTEIETGLLKVEGRGNRGGTRAMMLSKLHERTRDDFVLASGFGSVRMMRVRAQHLELPDFEPERLQCPTEKYPDGGKVDDVPPRPMVLAAAPAPDDLKSMHFYGLEDLFDSRSMGYVLGEKYAAGFESHRFNRVPTIRTADETSTWQVVRLELVSLLKYDRPMAYSSAELPRMDALEAMPRRELVAFETGALDRLRQGEDVVFETAGNQIQMLGSLRAAQDCLDCHTAQRGELLGALSYELLPAALAGAEEPR